MLYVAYYTNSTARSHGTLSDSVADLRIAGTIPACTLYCYLHICVHIPLYMNIALAKFRSRTFRWENSYLRVVEITPPPHPVYKISDREWDKFPRVIRFRVLSISIGINQLSFHSSIFQQISLFEKSRNFYLLSPLPFIHCGRDIPPPSNLSSCLVEPILHIEFR